MHQNFAAPTLRDPACVCDLEVGPLLARRRLPADQVTSLDDAALVASITRADRHALAEVYRRHASRVGSLAQRLCGPDADDVVQDVFIRLWQYPDRFDPERGSLDSFLLLLAYGRAIDVLRSADSRRAREKRDASCGSAGEVQVEGEALARLEAESVRALLHRLPDRERQAIALAFLDGHTYREVAVLLQQPEGTIKTRIRSGLSRLARWRAEPAGVTADRRPSGGGAERTRSLASS